jgi:hypothetical protein
LPNKIFTLFNEEDKIHAGASHYGISGRRRDINAVFLRIHNAAFPAKPYENT